MKRVLSLVEVDKRLAKFFRGASVPHELPPLLAELRDAKYAMTKEQITIASHKILEN